MKKNKRKTNVLMIAKLEEPNNLEKEMIIK